MGKQSRRERLMVMITQQREWIERCGGDLAGYIRRYGDPGVPPVDENGNSKTFRFPEGEPCTLEPVPDEPGMYYMPHFGNGGTAIWNADYGMLKRLESELALLRGRRVR